MDRRTFLGVAAAGAATTMGSKARAEGTARVAVRFVHLTDVHLEPEGGGPARFAAALSRIDGLAERPDFILNGGDAIYDALAREREDVASQWRIWHEIVEKGTSLPWRHCIGNHDVYGWHRRGDAAVVADPLYGKAWVLRELGLERSYYAFDHGGWRFLVLDSNHPHPVQDYTARLEEAQMSWLAGELEATQATTPVCVVSHIPILSACAPLWFGATPTAHQRELVNLLLVHDDAPALDDLFSRHGNVRLCLSGHLHMRERIDYKGTTYLCDGAVCGNWWNPERPAFNGFMPAMVAYELLEDGGFRRTVLPLH